MSLIKLTKEGFQTSSLLSQAELSLSNFYSVWNSFPTGLAKNADISGVLTTWNAYVSDVSPFKGTIFSQLDHSVVNTYTVTLTYVNNTTTTNFVLSNIKLNNIITPPNQTLTISPRTSYTSYNCPASYYPPYGCSVQIIDRTYDNGNRYNVHDLQGNVIRYNSFIPTNYCYAWCYDKQMVHEFGPATSTTTITNSTGILTVNLSVSSPSSIFSVTASYSPSIEITVGTQTYTTGSININITNMAKLQYDFNNIYTALLIDLYTTINSRHSTSPPVPYTVPTFTPAINPSTNRSNAMSGTNTDSIKSLYLSTYLPALYTATYNQVNAMITEIERIWGLLSSSASSLFPTLTNVTTDIQAFKLLPSPSMSTADTVVSNITSITNIFYTYSSNYKSIVAEETNIAVHNALSKFFTTYNGTLPSGFVMPLIISQITTRWNTYIDRTAVSNKYKGVNYSQVSEGICSSQYTLSTSYSNDTNNASFTFSNVIINDEISLSDINMSINRRTISYIGCPSTAPYTSNGISYTGKYNSDYTPFGETPQCLYVYTISPGDPGNFGVPKQFTTTPGTGVVTTTLNAPNTGTCIYKINVSYNILSSITVNGTSYVSPISIIIKNKDALIYDLKNSYAKLIITIYNFINTRHSYLPIILWNAPSTSPTNISTDLTNATTVISVYNESYLSSLYTSVYNQTKTMIDNLQGVTSASLSTDTATITQLTAIPKTSSLLSDLITISNIFNTYKSSYDTLIGQIARTKVSDFYNNSYIPGARFLKSTDMSLTVPYAGGTLTLQQVATKCLNYLNVNGTVKNTVLQTGDTTFSVLLALMNAANTKFVTAIIDGFYTVHTDWITNKGLTSLTGIPSDQGAADKTALSTAFDTTRTTYLGSTRGGALISAIKLRTKAVVNFAKSLQTWKTTAKGISLTPTGLSATTGLGYIT